MYALYFATGAILLLLGCLIAPYLIYLKCTGRIRTILTISEAFSLISIGAFYFFCAVTLSNLNLKRINDDVVKNNPLAINRSDSEQFFNISTFYHLHSFEVDTNVYYFGDSEETTQEPDYEELTTIPSNNKTMNNEFLLSYQLLLKQLMNSSKNNNESGENKRKSRENVSEEFMEEILLRHAILVYSFVHGLMSLINSTTECKLKQTNTLKIKVHPNTPEKQSKSNKNKITKTTDGHKTKIYFTILVTWLIPILSTSSMYLVVDFNTTPTAQPYFNYTQVKSILKPLNTSSNEEDVNLVVEKVYDIVKNVSELLYKKPPAPQDAPKHLQRQPKISHMNQSKPFKIHTFLVFIVTYFVVVLYASVQLMPTNMKDTKRHKTCVWATSLNWLPSILDAFMRFYMGELKPSLATDLFLTLGNANKMFWNVYDLLKIKSVSKINDCDV